MYSNKKTSNAKSIMIIGGVIGIVAAFLFAYLMFYTSPVHVEERVRVVANTDKGCIVETIDGHAINIGPCDAQPDQYIIASIDQKIKERAMLMNPTQ